MTNVHQPGPLAGKRILVSRAKEQAGSLSETLRDSGAEVLEIPFIEIRPPKSFAPLDDAITRITDYDWLVLTSVNGVRALFDRLTKLGRDQTYLLHLNIAAIGPATRKAIEEHGLPVDVVPDEYVAESVVEYLRDQVKRQRVLLVRAKIARDVIPRELTALGARVDVVEAYETIVPETSRQQLLDALNHPAKRPHVITFTSSSTVKNFLALLGDHIDRKLLDGIIFASIGPVTSVTLRQVGLRVDLQATDYTIPGLVAAIVSFAR